VILLSLPVLAGAITMLLANIHFNPLGVSSTLISQLQILEGMLQELSAVPINRFRYILAIDPIRSFPSEHLATLGMSKAPSPNTLEFYDPSPQKQTIILKMDDDLYGALSPIQQIPSPHLLLLANIKHYAPPANEETHMISFGTPLSTFLICFFMYLSFLIKSNLQMLHLQVDSELL
jgi:hypothetical protein